MVEILRAQTALRMTTRRIAAATLSGALLGGAILTGSLLCFGTASRAQEKPNPNAPVIKKVEPPNWWLNLTPDVLVLLSGKNLQATHASCNLDQVLVNRTQSSSNGDYLFLWLKLLPELLRVGRPGVIFRSSRPLGKALPARPRIRRL